MAPSRVVKAESFGHDLLILVHQIQRFQVFPHLCKDGREEGRREGRIQNHVSVRARVKKEDAQKDAQRYKRLPVWLMQAAYRGHECRKQNKGLDGPASVIPRGGREDSNTKSCQYKSACEERRRPQRHAEVQAATCMVDANSVHKSRTQKIKLGPTMILRMLNQ
jgi:hypothetical protein